MTIYRDSQGKTISLKKLIASSGEGKVWETNRNGYLAKIYNQPTPERAKKLRVMVKNPPDDPTRSQNHISIAWPKELITDNRGNCVGFFMPAINNAKELLYVYNPTHRQKNSPRFNWQYLHVTAYNIASIVSSLHDKNYIVGDMKSQNFLVNDKGMVSIIDTDSFQITDANTGTIHRCLVGSEGFTPPELLGKEISQVNQTKSHDRFRLAIVIHLLLFGYSPFERGKWTGYGNVPDSDVRVSKNLSIYAPNSSFVPDNLFIPLDVIHPQLKKLFLKCFNDGHKRTTLRPSAREWCNALQLAIPELKSCNQVANHVYSRTYGKCYWCERSNKLGVDIFSTQLQKKTSSQKSTQTSTPLSSTSQQSGEGCAISCMVIIVLGILFMILVSIS